mmetsp:Transcript_39159/g.125804  ORF Transcript_39159/g.125804 Transcript_39159/m.125804 type:complete len:206 (-) Transcript_39159:151-768(-)
MATRCVCRVATTPQRVGVRRSPTWSSLLPTTRPARPRRSPGRGPTGSYSSLATRRRTSRVRSRGCVSSASRRTSRRSSCGGETATRAAKLRSRARSSSGPRLSRTRSSASSCARRSSRRRRRPLPCRRRGRCRRAPSLCLPTKVQAPPAFFSPRGPPARAARRKPSASRSPASSKEPRSASSAPRQGARRQGRRRRRATPPTSPS